MTETVAHRPARRCLRAGGACVAALALGAGWGLHWWTLGRFAVETDNAYVRADVVTIAPRVAGTIIAVAVADNQAVRAGDVLARIDDRDYRNKLAGAQGALGAAEADLAAQQARVANLGAQMAEQRSVIAQGVAGVAGSMVEAHLAALENQRQALLARQQVNSAQALQGAEAGAGKASAALAEARARLATARAHLPVLVSAHAAAMADGDKARGMVRAAQAALAQARLDFGRTMIRAPVAGRIGQRTLRVGHYADVGTPLMALVPGGAYVVANYKETQTAAIRPGQPVAIAVDALGGAVLRGRVDSFAPATGAEFALLPPDNATGNFTKIVQRLPLRIRIDAGQTLAASLRPGMSVETTVDARP